MKTLTHISRKTGQLAGRHGFTLIELLIVIGILGILAAGLLAAVDPLEQLKKGRDTQKRNIAVEYHNALTRYYAVQGVFPWQTTDDTAILGENIDLGDMATTGDPSYTQLLIDAGELKSSFQEGLPGKADEQIKVLYPTAGGDVFVCFNPESKAVRGDPSTIFDEDAVIDTTNCPNSTSTTCYWCAR